MKIAKMYISKSDLASKWGVKEEDFVIAKVRSDYYSIEFDLIFTNEVESGEVEVVEVPESSLSLRRQKLYNE